MNYRFLIIFTLVVIVIVGVGFYFLDNSSKRTTNVQQIENTTLFNQSQQEASRLSVVVKNLQIPWALVFLPGGEILFTEREGRVRVIDKDGNLSQSAVLTLGDVKPIGEGGLLGMTLHPDFGDNGYVYLYYTYGETGGNTQNRVVRYRFNEGKLVDPLVIIDQIPGASNHNGGRIKFGPDSYLYITTGDAQEPSRSQDTSSLAGKILRVTDEGKPALGNPFGNLIYSYGHRNPQGLAWDDQGRLWETEHGSSATDEVNLIEIGKNYGWPQVRGDQRESGVQAPVIHSGSDTWAPSGAVFYNGSIYFAGLRGQSLFEYQIESGKLVRHLQGELGRIREVVLGPGDMLYITTNNRDGRGTLQPDDDRIIRVNPSLF